MKPIKTILIIAIPTLLFLYACGEEKTQSPPDDTTAQTETTEESTTRSVETAADEIQLAVCLWPQAGLRSVAGRGKDAKWIAGVSFGEVVTLTGNDKDATDKKNYLEMELSDGKKGWSNGYLFAVNAMRAAATGTVDIYNRPDLSTFEGKQFELGEIFAVIEGEEKGDWLEVYGKEKKKKGWINKNSKFSTDEVDVNVAIMYSRALQEKTPIAQAEKLENLGKSSLFAESPLMSIVNEKLGELKTLTDLPPNQLMVITDNLNARSEADPEADNILFKLQAGDICNILERGEKMEIRTMNDYWYLVEKDGNEGWIYGHFTSKKQE